MLDRCIPLKSLQCVVRPNAVIMLIVKVQRQSCCSSPAKLRRRFAHLSVAAVLRVGAQPNSVRLEELGVFLLRNALGERCAADRRKEIREQELVKPDGFEQEYA